MAEIASSQLLSKTEMSDLTVSLYRLTFKGSDETFYGIAAQDAEGKVVESVCLPSDLAQTFAAAIEKMP